jgi:hypothetical protein
MSVEYRSMPTVDYRQFINRNLPIRERACESKTVYVSRGDARSSARNGRRQDGSLAPYHCRYCSLWHLGHRRHRHHRPRPS